METIKKEEKSSYRGILKATSLFGGVQFYHILIEIIKSKFVAVLLGPVGVGIQGLYNSAINMIQHLTSCGLSSSAVRNVAEAYGTGDFHRINSIVTALRRLVWLTGLVGTVVVIMLSPVLSKASFGDYNHVWAFIILSSVLLLHQITSGQKVLLQGTRKFKYLAKCTTYGVTISLIVSVPLYYIWGVKAIVPNIVITAVATLFLSWYFSRKVLTENVRMSISETFKLGRSMLTMGITMSLTHFLPLVSAFILRSFIRYVDGVDAVGLFTAGFLLMTQYTGMIFQAMATDYYPRLAAVNKDNDQCCKIMNRQGEVGLILLGPLLLLCIVFAPIGIRILYSEEFLAIFDYIVWCAIGVIFQMASWAVSYVFIAKAESRLFALNEVSVGIYSLGLNLLGYYLGGLTGLGISFVIKYLIYLFQVYYIARKKYDFFFTSSFLKTFITQFLLVLLGAIVALMFSATLKYVVGSLIIVVSFCTSYKELNKRIDITSIINDKLKKKSKNR